MGKECCAQFLVQRRKARKTKGFYDATSTVITGYRTLKKVGFQHNKHLSILKECPGFRKMKETRGFPMQRSLFENAVENR